MLRALASGFAFTLALLLAACGDSDPGTAMGSPGPTATVQSNVVKGLIRNGVVKALRWQDGAYVQVASATTGGDGSFTLTIPDPVPGEVLRLELGVAANGSTQMQCDMADCGFATRGEWGAIDSDFGLTSWASVDDEGNVTVMPMTPVSTLLVRYAETFGGGRLTPTAVAAASNRVASMFNMSVSDLLVRPGSVVDASWMSGASPEAIKLSLLSAAFADLAGQQGTSIEAMIEAYADAFVENNGHLFQDGMQLSIGDIFRAVQNILATGADPTAVEPWMADWATAVLNSLQYFQLNTVTCSGTCPAFNSNDIISALGTGENTLGGDLQQVMAAHNVTKLEKLVAHELAKYGWLMSQDSLDVVQVAMRVAGFAIGATTGMPLGTLDGLTATAKGGVMRVTGTHTNGMQVDVTVNLAPVFALIQNYDPDGEPPVFTFAAQGTVQNANVRASIDGSFSLDSSGTDLTALRDAVNPLLAAILNQDSVGIDSGLKALLPAIADLIRTGEATFNVEGSAGIAKLELVGDAVTETSRLAIQGKGWMQVDMNGGAGGAIKANGAAEYGQITLPNGDHFVLDPEQGHELVFALDVDGTASATFDASVLGYAADVSGSGSIGKLGTLISNLRNGIALQLDALATNLQLGLNLNAMLLQLLTDFGNLTLTVNGQAHIPALNDHTYTLTIADGHLRLSQPNSTVTALDVSLGGSELLVQAGDKWWLVGLDLQNYGYPALVIADSAGGEWNFDLMALLAAN